MAKVEYDVSPALSIVVGFRDRDLLRVERCLDSLAAQGCDDFEVLFVDYGSRLELAEGARRLTSTFPFVKYVYSSTRGLPWSRSRALNIGCRQARGKWLMTSDVDMIFRRDFVAVALERINRDRTVHCRPYLLPHDFSDWEQPEAHTDHLARVGTSALGGCQLVSTEIFHQLRGFDEYYEYWGIEDRDLNHRLREAGLAEQWIEDATDLFHQWHPPADVKTPGFLPAGLWGRMELYYHEHKATLVRNDASWGKLLTDTDRAVFAFVDPATGALRDHDELVMFDERPDDPRSVGWFVRAFWDLAPGEAIAVWRADVPERRRWLDVGLRATNRLLSTVAPQSRLGYANNLLHTFIAEMSHERPEALADYYLSLDTNGSVSVLVRGPMVRRSVEE